MFFKRKNVRAHACAATLGRAPRARAILASSGTVLQMFSSARLAVLRVPLRRYFHTQMDTPTPTAHFGPGGHPSGGYVSMGQHTARTRPAHGHNMATTLGPGGHPAGRRAQCCSQTLLGYTAGTGSATRRTTRRGATAAPSRVASTFSTTARPPSSTAKPSATGSSTRTCSTRWGAPRPSTGSTGTTPGALRPRPRWHARWWARALVRVLLARACRARPACAVAVARAGVHAGERA